MFINGVKVTLTICLTIIVSCVLFISYSEYTNRYMLIPAQDNGVFIFDKKSTILNKCDDNSCKLLETKLPAKSNGGIIEQINQVPSKMFGEDKPMTEAIVNTEAIPADKNSLSDSEEASGENKQKENKQKEVNDEKDKSQNKKVDNTNKTITVKQQNK